MFDFFEIKNFRCFESLKVTGLSRVNLIGWTQFRWEHALLEALFIASGASPELAFRVKSLRGLPRFENGEQTAYRILWKDLFFGFDEARHIRIVLGKGGTELRSLGISYTSPQGVLFPHTESGLSTDHGLHRSYCFPVASLFWSRGSSRAPFWERRIHAPPGFRHPTTSGRLFFFGEPAQPRRSRWLAFATQHSRRRPRNR